MRRDPGCKNDIAAFISAIPSDLHNRILLHTVGIDNRLALRVPVCGRVRAPPGFEEKIAAHYRSRVHGQYTRGRLYCFSIDKFFVTDAYGKLFLAREIFTEYTVTAGMVTRARQFTAFEPSRLGTGTRQRWICTGRISPDPRLPDLHSYPCEYSPLFSLTWSKYPALDDEHAFVLQGAPTCTMWENPLFGSPRSDRFSPILPVPSRLSQTLPPMKITGNAASELISIASMIEQLYLIDHETATQAALDVVQSKRIPRKLIVYTELPDKREVPCVRFDDAIEVVQKMQAYVPYRIQNNWASTLDSIIYCLREAGSLLFDQSLVQPNQKQKRYERRLWSAQHDPTYYAKKRAADRKWRLSKRPRTESDSN